MGFKVRLKPEGRGKYLAIGIIMAVIGALMLFFSLRDGWYGGEVVTLYTFLNAALFLCAAMMIWIWRDMKKRGIEQRGDAVPQRYVFLVVGFLFSAVFGAFLAAYITLGFEPPPVPAAIALWSSVAIFGMTGPLLLVLFFRHRAGGLPEEEIEKREMNIGAVVGAAVAIVTILGLIAAGIGLLVFSSGGTETVMGIAFVAGPIVIGGFIALVYLASRRRGAGGR